MAASPGFDPDTLVIGVVGRPFGLAGEVTIRPYNEHGTALANVVSLVLEREGTRRVYDIVSRRAGPSSVRVKLAGVDDRDAAAALTLSLVRVPRAVLPPLEPGEYYVEDVIGCAVTGTDGAPLGVAVGTFWNGAHDVMTVVMTVEAEEGSATVERLIPLVPRFVVEVDAPGRKIKVDWDDR